MNYRPVLYILLFIVTVLQANLPHSPQNSQLETDINATPPCVIVIFGCTGDLTARKLLPALYNLAKEGHLAKNTVIVGYARRDLTDNDFRLLMEEAINQFSRTKLEDQSFWDLFKNKIFYHRGDFDKDSDYNNLEKRLAKIDHDFGTNGNRIYYLATQPSYFPTIVTGLHNNQLIYDTSETKWSRVLIEKPFGDSLHTALNLQTHLSTRLHEDQTFRIDHYLGKEGVQNLLALRLENRRFEPVWNHKHIDNVQITLSENIGIGTRGTFWEETGALRDLFQNHLMQLLAIVAMEPPLELNAENIHKEKIKALKSVRPLPPQDFDKMVIRGQYGIGQVDGINVPGYRQEQSVSSTSNVETYMAATLYIDNERWKNVPFYIRGGKRLSRQLTEIAITFKPDSEKPASVLFIRIQPNMGIHFKNSTKSPDLLDKSFSDSGSSTRSPDAYEKLFYDSIHGDKKLFVNSQEQIIAWQLLTPVLEHWHAVPPTNFPNYPSGSRGPVAADKMLQDNGHEWITSDSVKSKQY